LSFLKNNLFSENYLLKKKVKNVSTELKGINFARGPGTRVERISGVPAKALAQCCTRANQHHQAVKDFNCTDSHLILY